MSKGVAISRDDAMDFFNSIRLMGIKGELVGSLWRGTHAQVHDIDILVRDGDWEGIVEIIESIDGNPPVEVEFYVVSEGADNYERVLTALRASRYELIKGRLMKGCKFRRIKWTDVSSIPFRTAKVRVPLKAMLHPFNPSA